MSFRDIGVILNKRFEYKNRAEEIKQGRDKKDQDQQQQKNLSLSAQVYYKLFSKGKTPLDVSVELNTTTFIFFLSFYFL
jgi:hypothetical protein